MKTIFSKGIRRERKMKEKEKIDLSNRVGDISMNIEKIKDLSVLLSEYFREENFEPVKRLRKEGKESRLELLSSEVMMLLMSMLLMLMLLMLMLLMLMLL